ncbi:hypothetical protein K440DRAFT_674046 [Wilcoxina mikolae CBS 423.85]|nr:hypothetical protein K440DRAFT_674046 [Wilcoxina mikolae CBS 423.85]
METIPRANDTVTLARSPEPSAWADDEDFQEMLRISKCARNQSWSQHYREKPDFFLGQETRIENWSIDASERLLIARKHEDLSRYPEPIQEVTEEMQELWGDILSGDSNAGWETPKATNEPQFPIESEVNIQSKWVLGLKDTRSGIRTKDVPPARFRLARHSGTQSSSIHFANKATGFAEVGQPSIPAPRPGSTVYLPARIKPLTTTAENILPHSGAESCAEDFIPLPDVTSDIDGSPPHLSGLVTPVTSSPREFFTPLASPSISPARSSGIGGEAGRQALDPVPMNQTPLELPNVESIPGHQSNTLATPGNKPFSGLSDLEIFPEPSKAKELDCHSTSSLSDITDSFDMEAVEDLEVKRITRANNTKAVTSELRRRNSKSSATPAPLTKATPGTLRSTRRTTVMAGAGLTEEERMAEIVRQARLESNTGGGERFGRPGGSSRKVTTRLQVQTGGGK